MSSITNDILGDLRDTLRDAGLFASVNLGGDRDTNRWPRAVVEPAGVEQSPDDAPSRWLSVRAAVRVLCRSESPENLTRALDLAQSAQAALLVDPGRGQRCQDLPAGRATQIGRLAIESGHPPYLAVVAFDVACHVDMEGPALTSFDGQELFASGPHSFQPGSWQRGLIRRSFAGVDDELLLDLGRRSRTMRQRGRLHGTTLADLQAQIDAIEAACDAQTHDLTDNLGRLHERVVMEGFELLCPIQAGCGFCCDYQIEYRQLP